MLEVVGIGEGDAVQSHVELTVDESPQALVLRRIEARPVGRGADEARGEVGGRAVVTDGGDRLLDRLTAHQ
jgi:hypothetical protein